MFSFVPKKLKKSLNNYQNTTKLIKQHSQDVAGLTYFNRSTNFNVVNVTIDSIVGSKQPEMHNPNRFYKIYSPEKFKVRPRGSIRNQFPILNFKLLNKYTLYVSHL